MAWALFNAPLFARAGYYATNEYYVTTERHSQIDTSLSMTTSLPGGHYKCNESTKVVSHGPYLFELK
jgi:hypothetical protein